MGRLSRRERREGKRLRGEEGRRVEEKFGPVPSMISTQECGWGMSGAHSLKAGVWVGMGLEGHSLPETNADLQRAIGLW